MTTAIELRHATPTGESAPEADYYLAAHAVSDDHCGAGIGSLRFADVERRGRDAECRRVALDVPFNNRSAKALYERLGMVAKGTSPAIRFMPRETNEYPPPASGNACERRA